jgi:hypothetical protein
LKTAGFIFAFLTEQESGIVLDARGIKKIHLLLWDQAIKSTEVNFQWLWLFMS